MEKHVLDFTLGVNTVGDKAIIKPGFATMLDGVDLRSGSPRCYPSPVKVKDAVSQTTRRIFEFHGRIFESDKWRDYATQVENSHDVVYWTEDGQYPYVNIDDSVTRLSIPSPRSAPLIVATSQLSPNVTATASSTGGSFQNGSVRSYRVAVETPDGIQIPSGGVSVVFSSGTNTNSVVLTWAAMENAIAYHIFAGASGKDQFIGKIGATSVTYADDGTRSSTGEYAEAYDSLAPYQYIYTLERLVGGTTYESAPSPISSMVTTNIGRSITIDTVADGFYDSYNTVTISSGITLTVSASSTITLVAATQCSAVNGMKFECTGGPHRLKTGEKVRFPYTTDPNWMGRDIEVVVDAESLYIFYVENLPVISDLSVWFSGSPYVARVTTTIDLATAPSSIIENDTAVLLTTSKGGVTTTAVYQATRVTDTQFTVNFYTEAGTTCTAIKFNPDNNFLTFRNIYRTTAGGGFLLVEALKPWQTTYGDTKSDMNLGHPPTSYYIDGGQVVVGAEAPIGLSRITLHHGMLFGIVGKSVRWTPIGQHSIWPETFMCDGFSGEPVALMSFAGALIVLCLDGIYRLDGNTATGMSLQGTHASDGCIAPHSVQVSSEAGLLYISKRGLMAFDGMHARCITDDKVPSSVFFGPSQQNVASNSHILETLDSHLYAELSFDDGVIGTNQETYRLHNTNVIHGTNYDIKSFIYNGKYFCFWSNETSNYGSHTTLVVDLKREDFPITSMPLRIVDVCVSDTERVYALLKTNPYLSITASITETIGGG